MEIRLPRGPATAWDMTKLTNEQLLYEAKLCEENLYGVWLPKYNIGLKGFMNETHEERGCSEETFKHARQVWLLRHKRATDELFERELLVRS